MIRTDFCGDFHKVAMTKQERKAAMALKEVTQAEIARDTGFSDAYVHEVINGTRRNGEIEKATARRCGKSVNEMFGPNGRTTTAVR